MNQAVRSRSPWLGLAAALVALDQYTKHLVQQRLPLHSSIDVLEGFVDLTHVRNRGGAFGFLSDANLPAQPLWFALVGVIALAGIAWYSFRTPAGNRLVQTALSLVMAGAVGNLIDRARFGYVVDFVDVYWGPYHWPAFNVADSAISIGVALLILDMIRTPDPSPEQPVQADSEPGSSSHSGQRMARIAAAGEQA